jgi:hypothetical protein
VFRSGSAASRRLARDAGIAVARTASAPTVTNGDRGTMNG